MDFGAAFWIQRSDWPALRNAAVAAEAAGFDAVWFDDHLLSDEGDWVDPKLEGWLALAALAPLTTHVKLGHLVVANTFRNPGLTAKLATTLDHAAGGRFILGLGGGWFEREHDAFGLDFGSGFGERLDRLEEATGLIRRLLDGDRVTHEGRFYRMHEALCLPEPIQTRLPILVGGSGRTKTLRTVARHADLWNGYGEPDRIAEVSGWLRERCVEEGRPFEDIARTVSMDVVIRDSPAEAAAAYAAVIAAQGMAVERNRLDGTERGLNAGGPPELIADYVRRFEGVGVSQVAWIFRSPWDRETIARLPEVRALL
ncbi:MAG: LLM class flavin-dependent oxidoreductase [Chloroflexi bacterium]|nr:LLM class flavin-dependent oxidoreductase [Chloroflexota bacterium]